MGGVVHDLAVIASVHGDEGGTGGDPPSRRTVTNPGGVAEGLVVPEHGMGIVLPAGQVGPDERREVGHRRVHPTAADLSRKMVGGHVVTQQRG